MACFSFFIEYKINGMKTVLKNSGIQESIQDEPREKFYMGATIAVILLFLLFIGASFYIVVSSYMEL